LTSSRKPAQIECVVSCLNKMKVWKKRIAKSRRIPFTGRIWKRRRADRARIVREVCKALECNYGRPTHGNLDDPLDELVYIILTNRTAIEVAQQCFAQIKARFPAWDDVLRAPPHVLRKILGPAGLSLVKSRQIRSTLGRIKRDFGNCELSALRSADGGEVELYLLSLPGVSTKVARCVMMYTLGAEVLPVDAHVHRIAVRLGWIDRKRADQSHEELDALIPARLRYAFHVDCIAHGRAVCRSQKPDCAQCCLRGYCSYPKARKSAR
jgi:endonuclease III